MSKELCGNCSEAIGCQVLPQIGTVEEQVGTSGQPGTLSIEGYRDFMSRIRLLAERLDCAQIREVRTRIKEQEDLLPTYISSDPQPKSIPREVSV